jgi:hypothetical protein
MTTKADLQKDIISELIKTKYFSLKDNSEKTKIRAQLAKDYKVDQVWIKDVVINGYGKEGRRISNERVLEILSADPSNTLITKTSEDPAEGLATFKNSPEKIYFVSSAPGQEGVGIVKLQKKRKETNSKGLLILNNGNEGPISDARFNEIKELGDGLGILSAAVYRDGVSHKAQESALNVAGLINTICDFCAAYDQADGPWRTNTDKAINVRANLERLGLWIRGEIASLSQKPFSVEISKGTTNVPKVLWICLLPSNQEPSNGVYVSICFDRKGRGLVCGFSESASNPKGLKTVKRSESLLRIDVDGVRPGTKFNDTFVNPLEIFKEGFDEENFLKHLVTSLDLCENYLEKSNNSLPVLMRSYPREVTSLTSENKNHFEKSLKNTGYVSSHNLSGRFLVSLLAKPFVILTGNSGTGKTKIAELLIAWLHGDSTGNHELVSVGADWTDNRHVVGFVNYLRPGKDEKAPIYQSTSVIDLLLRATASPFLPFFLILDEMNLSHVERYLADFLSAMESREGLIRLHSEGPPDEKNFRLPRFDGDSVGVPRALAYPRNLFVIGTVNVDETTYMFSPKVLDRAHVIEIQADSDSIGKFLANPQTLQAMEPASEKVSTGFLDLSKAVRGIGASLVEPFSPTVTDAINKHLKSILAILCRGRFEFAFRTVKELNSYLRVCRRLAKDKDSWDSGMKLSKKNRDEGRVNWLSDLDDEILQKILPRLHGSRSRMGSLVGALICYFSTGKEADALKFFPDDGKEEAAKTLTDAIILAPDAPEFPRCFKKMQTMARVLVEEQFVSFIC